MNIFPDTAEWQGRQDRAQIELKRLTKLKVTEALEEIKVDEMMASLEATTPGEKKNRRAVVFYMDQGKSGILMCGDPNMMFFHQVSSS